MAADSPRFPESNAPLFQLAFVRKCHSLIALGYARLDTSSLSGAEETSITGELVRAIRMVLESEEAPNWAVHFFVADDPPQNAPGRLGKRRRRVDIEIERGQRGVRPRFHFEAKRLHHAGSLSDYLGAAGLGLFVAGEYASGQDVGGMIGYIQTGEGRVWRDKIRAALMESPERYGFQIARGFIEVQLNEGLGAGNVSHHDRNAIGHPIAIYHTLLHFVASAI